MACEHQMVGVDPEAQGATCSKPQACKPVRTAKVYRDINRLHSLGVSPRQASYLRCTKCLCV